MVLQVRFDAAAQTTPLKLTSALSKRGLHVTGAAAQLARCPSSHGHSDHRTHFHTPQPRNKASYK